MSAPTSVGRRGRGWAFAGGVVLLAGVIAVVLIAVWPRPDQGMPTPNPTTPTATAEPTVSPSLPPEEAVVDASVTERGWVPEPITTDPEAYMRAALAAASTFDPALSTREEWLDHLDTWFTPDTRYTSPEDRAEAMKAVQLEMRQGVVLPETMWDQLADQGGRVSAEVTSDITDTPVSNDPSGDMRIGTADVLVSYVFTGESGGESGHDETVRVSVQVLCGPESVPTPGTAQRAGDCKLVRYFTEPLEP